MSSNRKNKKNNKKKNVLNSYTMEALEPRLMMAMDCTFAMTQKM